MLADHRKTILLLIALQPVIGFPTGEDDGLGKVIGGEEASEGKFTYQVSLQYLGTHVCGGVLINLSTILSAASCVESGSISTFVAVAGKIRLSQNDTTSQSRSITRMHLHGSYPGATGISNDIAVLKVLTPFQTSAYVQPIQVAPQGYFASGVATVSGFGSLWEGSEYSDILMKVTIPIVSDTICRNAYGAASIEDSMLCAGSEGRGDCTGDAGGPLVIENSDLGPARYLVGIASFGRGCGRIGYPGVYTEISYFTEFINMYA